MNLIDKILSSKPFTSKVDRLCPKLMILGSHVVLPLWPL